MNFKEYMKDKNVMSVDVWMSILFVLIVFLLRDTVPQIEPLSQEQLSTVTPVVVSTILINMLGLFVFGGMLLIIILLCSRLRKYRYIDIYIQCKKLKSRTANIIAIIAFIFEITAAGFIFWFVAVYIPILSLIYMLVVCTILAILYILMAIRLNNSKDLKQ